MTPRWSRDGAARLPRRYHGDTTEIPRRYHGDYWADGSTVGVVSILRAPSYVYPSTRMYRERREAPWIKPCGLHTASSLPPPCSALLRASLSSLRAHHILGILPTSSSYILPTSSYYILPTSSSYILPTSSPLRTCPSAGSTSTAHVSAAVAHLCYVLIRSSSPGS